MRRLRGLGSATQPSHVRRHIISTCRRSDAINWHRHLGVFRERKKRSGRGDVKPSAREDRSPEEEWHGVGWNFYCSDYQEYMWGRVVSDGGLPREKWTMRVKGRSRLCRRVTGRVGIAMMMRCITGDLFGKRTSVAVRSSSPADAITSRCEMKAAFHPAGERQGIHVSRPTLLIHISRPRFAPPCPFSPTDGAQSRIPTRSLNTTSPSTAPPPSQERCAYPLLPHPFIPRMPSPLYVSPQSSPLLAF